MMTRDQSRPPAVCTVSKTVSQLVENEDGNTNHSHPDKGLHMTVSGKLRNKPPTYSTSSPSPSVLALLEKNKTNTIIPAPPNHDLSDEVVCVEGPDIREVQREALQKARITDNVQKWADTFANADVDTLVQNITFITDRYQAILPQYLIALRAVSQSIPSPEAGIVHLRNYLLEAIGKGWTLNNSNMTVNEQQFGLEEAILAIASYHCRTVITESEESLFSTVTRVVSNISMEDQETLLDGIKVQCLACSKEEEISAFTHCTTISVEMILQCSAAELFHGVEPIFDAADYFANTPHDPSCRIANNLKKLRH